MRSDLCETVSAGAVKQTIFKSSCDRCRRGSLFNRAAREIGLNESLAGYLLVALSTWGGKMAVILLCVR